MTKELQKGNLVPAAKPVSSFLGWRKNDPARPAQPALMPQPKGVNIIQRGNNMNVQGYNNVAELAEALKPLTDVVDAGMKLHASNEYKKGQNEILKAAAQINRDQVIKGVEFAKENRALERVNPVAAVMMDEVNPYRTAGRVNQASVIVANQIPVAFRSLWNSSGGELAKLDPSDPRLDQVRSQMIQSITSKYALDEFSHGFQEKVMPVFNREWERFGEKQYSANIKYKKQVKKYQFKDLLQQELFLYDGTNQEEVFQKVFEAVQQFNNEAGLGGDGPKTIEEVWLELATDLQIIAGDPDHPLHDKAANAHHILRSMPSGQGLSKEGLPITVGDAFGTDLYLDTDKIASATKRKIDNQQFVLKHQLEAQYLEKIRKVYESQDEVAMKDLLAEIRANPLFDKLSASTLNEVINFATAESSAEAELLVNKIGINKWFEKQTFLIGSDFDPAEANKQFQVILDDISPLAFKYRQDLLKRYAKLIESKEKELDNIFDKELYNKQIANAIKYAVQLRLPDLETAAIRGDDNIDNILAWGEAANEKGVLNLGLALRTEVRDALLNKARELQIAPGSSLPMSVQSEVIKKAINDIVGNETRMNLLMPPPKEPGTVDLPPTPPDGVYFSRANDIPVERSKTWEQYPLYTLETTKKVWEHVKEGGKLPITLRKFANRSKISPERIFLKQLDFYKGQPNTGWMPTNQERIEFLKEGTQAKGFSDGFLVGAGLPGPIGSASRVFENILMGV